MLEHAAFLLCTWFLFYVNKLTTRWLNVTTSSERLIHPFPGSKLKWPKWVTSWTRCLALITLVIPGDAWWSENGRAGHFFSLFYCAKINLYESNCRFLSSFTSHRFLLHLPRMVFLRIGWKNGEPLRMNGEILKLIDDESDKAGLWLNLWKHRRSSERFPALWYCGFTRWKKNTSPWKVAWVH